MARGRSTEDISTLQMALVGYQIEKQRIESKMQEIQSHLKGKRVAFAGSGAETAAAPRKRVLSEAARSRIAAAQKKRWAEHRKRAAAAARGAKAPVAKAGAATS
jgi:hypothetical protein